MIMEVTMVSANPPPNIITIIIRHMLVHNVQLIENAMPMNHGLKKKKSTSLPHAR